MSLIILFLLGKSVLGPFSIEESSTSHRSDFVTIQTIHSTSNSTTICMALFLLESDSSSSFPEATQWRAVSCWYHQLCNLRKALNKIYNPLIPYCDNLAEYVSLDTIW